MEKPPFKFQIGEKVRIGETEWGYSEMKARKGEIGVITERTFCSGYGNGNHYRLDGDWWFEEDCLTLEEENPIKEITNDEINDILQG